MLLKCFPVILLCSIFSVKGITQLFPITLEHKISAAAIIVEGKVIEQKSFWNENKSMVFTTNLVQISGILKGASTNTTIQIITQGGSVDGYYIEATHLLQLEKGQEGIFFCQPLQYKLTSPFKSIPIYDVYSSDQGFYRYTNNIASATLDKQQVQIDSFCTTITKKTGQAIKIIHPPYKEKSSINLSTAKTTATITSYSPSTVTAGTLNDPTNNVLTINGTGFGDTPASPSAVLFKDADNSNSFPTVTIPFNSPYIISWTDAQIRLRVPSKAATGRFAVVKTPGDTAYAPTSIEVFYSILNATFNLNGTVVVKEPRLMNTNGQGGYSVVYSTSTAGGGKNLNTAPEKASFQRALTTWKEVVGYNIIENGSTIQQSIDPADQSNIIMFDNTNTGVPPLADGVLAVTYSGYSMCNNAAFEAQKVGFDIVIRNAGVSVGNINFEIGPCFPSTSEIDLEAVLLHELGHAINLGHINDPFQVSGTTFNTTNPAKLMHFSVLVYTNRRSLDHSALQGGLYCVTPKNKTYGNCGLFTAEMIPSAKIIITNDECPATFPAEATASGSAMNIDLNHATSNKYKDPQFTAANCSNTGSFITNNAYYVMKTGTTTGILNINISNYTTAPADQGICTEQGVRLAIYEVSSCPVEQQYPQPIVCRTFNNNGALAEITGLQTNATYLLFFEGLRNTKANFTATLTGNILGEPTIPNPTNPIPAINTYPNPVNKQLTVEFKDFASDSYTIQLFDEVGRRVFSNSYNITSINAIAQINMSSYADGIYHLVILNNSNTIVRKPILKLDE